MNTDCCSRCFTPTMPQDDDEEPQRYICATCGRSWTTSRDRTVYASPADTYAVYDDPDAWEAEDPTEPWWAD
ncbi:hypothetical protein ACFU3O_12960 [Streptomyces antibioticus]|uniref:hypothetical protein n=1 Tax=Streptomyces antibioticus TaxID=1890 RepID=UPI003692AD86